VAGVLSILVTKLKGKERKNQKVKQQQQQ